MRLTREALGMEAAQLCRLMGDIPPARWNNAETGDNYPSPVDLSRFYQVTGANADWIMRGIRHNLPASLLEAITAREKALAPAPKRRRA